MRKACADCGCLNPRDSSICKICGADFGLRRLLGSFGIFILVAGPTAAVLTLPFFFLARFEAEEIEALKALSASIQSLSIVLGIVVGAAWTWWTSKAFRQNALLRMRADRELAASKARPNVLVEIKAAQVSITGDPGLYLSGQISLENTGNSSAQLEYDNPVKIAGIEIAEMGGQSVRSFQELPIITAPRVVKIGPNTSEAQLAAVKHEAIDSNSKAVHPFFVRVPVPGVYLIDFLVPVDENRAEALQGEAKEGPRFFNGRTFVAVNPLQAPEVTNWVCQA